MAENISAWPAGWPRSIAYPLIPVFEILDQTAARAPNRIALIFDGFELTYGELKELSDRFASALAHMGVRKGDRVVLYMSNCPQFVIAYYGLLKAGAVFTPLSPLLTPREALHQLKDCGAETMVSLDTLFSGIKGIISDTEIKRVVITSIADCQNNIACALNPSDKVKIPDTVDMVSLLRDHEAGDLEVTIDVTKDLAHLAYTGGTTGLSKGVMVTHHNVVVNTIQYGNWFLGARFEVVDGVITAVYPDGINPVRDRPAAMDCETTLVVAPWFHAMGTVGYLNLQIFCGYTMVVLPRFEVKEYLDAVDKYGVTLLGGPPQLYIPLFNHPDFDSYDFSKVKIARSGAAPLPVSLLDKMLNTFSGGTVCEGYGMTECTMGATATPPIPSSVRPGSVGIPIFDTECKIVDLTTGENLPPGREGEICIKGPQVMAGYWNRPEETSEILQNGWLHTGDIGKKDEDGFYYITGRKKDMIIYKGYNVYPREIEELLYGHPAIQRCGVVGKPNQDGGEHPVAFVELKQGARATAEEIMRYVNSEVAPYKKVREVVFLDAIPVSAAGKILKRELKKMLSSG